MSRNVFGQLPLSAALLVAAMAAAGVGWTSASTAGSAWNPPPAPVAHGLCSQACEVQACLEFAGGVADAERTCATTASHRVRDLRRAGPDQACVQKCAVSGAPVALSLLSDHAAVAVTGH